MTAPIDSAAPAPSMSVDQKSVDLAEHFMTDVLGHTAEDVRELAEAIQRICEDHCSAVEDRARPFNGNRPDEFFEEMP